MKCVAVDIKVNESAGARTVIVLRPYFFQMFENCKSLDGLGIFKGNLVGLGKIGCRSSYCV